MWFNHHNQGQQSCINLEPSPMGVGGHNVVLEVPRNMDMNLGVRRLFANAAPELIKQFWDMKTPKNGVARVTLHDPELGNSFVYFIYTRDRWEEPPDLAAYLQAMEVVRDDLKEMGQTIVSTTRPPCQEETDSWNKALTFLANIFQESGVTVNVYRDVYRGDPPAIFRET